MENIGSRTSSSSTSSTRVLPLLGSGEDSISLGVVWKRSIMCVCAAHSVTASSACSSGKMQNLAMKARAPSSAAAPSNCAAAAPLPSTSAFKAAASFRARAGALFCALTLSLL